MAHLIAHIKFLAKNIIFLYETLYTTYSCGSIHKMNLYLWEGEEKSVAQIIPFRTSYLKQKIPNPPVCLSRTYIVQMNIKEKKTKSCED